MHKYNIIMMLMRGAERRDAVRRRKKGLTCFALLTIHHNAIALGSGQEEAEDKLFQYIEDCDSQLASE